jgi:hypothetical protein
MQQYYSSSFVFCLLSKSKIFASYIHKSDCHLNQIFSPTRDGSASKILNQFFNYISLLPHPSGVIYLNVRSENDRSKKFYERNGMKFFW